MTLQYYGEIGLLAFSFAPKGWALCNGQLMAIAQNQALFSILGTMHGGDGRTTFALPNLQGRVPLHVGNLYSLGQSGGDESHTLTIAEMPSHTHQARGSSTGGASSPADAVPAPGTAPCTTPPRTRRWRRPRSPTWVAARHTRTARPFSPPLS